MPLRSVELCLLGKLLGDQFLPFGFLLVGCTLLFNFLLVLLLIGLLDSHPSARAASLVVRIASASIRTSAATGIVLIPFAATRATSALTAERYAVTKLGAEEANGCCASFH